MPKFKIRVKYKIERASFYDKPFFIIKEHDLELNVGRPLGFAHDLDAHLGKLNIEYKNIEEITIKRKGIK